MNYEALNNVRVALHAPVLDVRISIEPNNLVPMLHVIPSARLKHAGARQHLIAKTLTDAPESLASTRNDCYYLE